MVNSAGLLQIAIIAKDCQKSPELIPLSVRGLSMNSSYKPTRKKLSTTVSPETYEFLQNMVSEGEVASLAEGLDTVVARIRRLENRDRLAAATMTYFEQLDPIAAREEDRLSMDIGSARGR